MFSYETLDAIADSINPVFGVAALLMPWLKHFRSIRQGRIRQALAFDGMTLASVAIAYALQALDIAGSLWPRAGLDFSTHMAVFVAIAASLWQHGVVWRWTVVALGLAYAALMRVQDYHSAMDIISTSVAILPLLVLLWWRAARSLRSVESGTSSYAAQRGARTLNIPHE